MGNDDSICQVPVRDLVSTIIPVFNRAVLLREAIESVLMQTYRPIEIIIVDDESTDDTPNCIESLSAAYPDVIRTVRQKNAGPGVARETGRQLAHGEFIQYLDSDDILLPDKFAKQVGALRARPEAGVAYCWTRYRRIGETPHPEPWKRSGIVVDTMFPTFLVDRWWDTPTPLYRRDVCDAAGPWTNLRLEEDWEYDCRIAALGTQLAHVPAFLVEVRDHDGPRLCKGKPLDKERVRIRSRSQRLIFEHAIAAGICSDSPEMQRFARSLFLLSRQCGAVGLLDESQQLFHLAKGASGKTRSKGADFRLYDLGTRLIGWRAMGWLSCAIDKLRSSS